MGREPGSIMGEATSLLIGDPESDAPKIGGLITRITDHIESASDKDADFQSSTSNFVYCILLVAFLFIYIFCGGVLFMSLEKGWSLIDGWFFAVATISTVGYGVLTPTSDLCRVCVIVFLAFGMVYFVFSISFLVHR